ncbi:E3 ubiquitin-protein ligase XIAP-like [Biomphalaria glabrata]|uniref:E3 ubiquitin-protein ligase XIAP-like n=1 Tax=Biomphalaria glabrata TaxID=6526 RepID=A0A9W3A4V6_BIOGL|nr:E3 ubiquitin-protein ligase XIAP-like [Biomphalaria glabrata]
MTFCYIDKMSCPSKKHAHCSTMETLVEDTCSPQRTSARCYSRNSSVTSLAAFRNEWLRLSTFTEYPVSSPTSCLALARNGFFYKGSGADDVVTCYSCHVRISNWLEQDDVLEVHKTVSPSCPMVTGTESNNIPINPGDKPFDDLLSTLNNLVVNNVPNEAGEISILNAFTSEPQGDTRTTQRNMSSEDDYGNNQTVAQDSLLNAGRLGEDMFVSAGKETRQCSQKRSNDTGKIKIIASRGPETSWTHSDDLASEPHTFDVHSSLDHIDKISQENVKESTNKAHELINCNANSSTITQRPRSAALLFDRNSTVKLGTDTTIELHETCTNNDVAEQAGNGLDFTKIEVSTEKPICVDLANRSHRINTFKDCSKLHQRKVEHLADSGFYYTGSNSTTANVQCFVCGWKFINWEHEDDVWLQHALHSPTCCFVKQIKGQTYVDVVQELAHTKKKPTSAMETGATGGRVSPLDLRHGKFLTPDDIRLRCREKGKSSMSEDRQFFDSPSVPRKSDNLDVERLREENKNLRMRTSCKVCTDKEVEFVFLPCGHFIACSQCVNASAECKICKTAIIGILRAYIK